MPEPTTIIDIVKRRHKTGEYGNAHFAMPASTMSALRAATPKPKFEPPAYLGGRLGDLLSIPVHIDEMLPEGAWRLVGNSTGEVIAEGCHPTTDGRRQVIRDGIRWLFTSEEATLGAIWRLCRRLRARLRGSGAQDA
jgi:hypothetical protein